MFHTALLHFLSFSFSNIKEIDTDCSALRLKLIAVLLLAGQYCAKVLSNPSFLYILVEKWKRSTVSRDATIPVSVSVHP